MCGVSKYQTNNIGFSYYGQKQLPVGQAGPTIDVKQWNINYLQPKIGSLQKGKNYKLAPYKPFM